MGKGSYDVAIVGGGPVGMLTGLLFAAAGLRVFIGERRSFIPHGSRAIGISPPSLKTLEQTGLVDAFIAAGVPIRNVSVYCSRRQIGSVSFTGINSDYNYILSLPQEKTETLLWEAVGNNRHMEFAKSLECISMGISDGGLPAVGFRNDSGEIQEVSARLICACDGAESMVRGFGNRSFRGIYYPHSFVMADFRDASGFGEEARLFFTPDGAVESFPLPDGLRRWIVQTATFDASPPAELIARRVKERLPFDPQLGEPLNISPFRVRRNRIDRYWQRLGDGVVVYLGDAAHVMSPIGGQGMNTGFADADAAVKVLAPLLVNGGWGGTVGGSLLDDWERRRKRAFRVAADRAWASMTLGTVRGAVRSILRNAVLSMMLNGPWREKVPADYAMLTIPC